ncbi:MAG TPA: hypothetical protein VMW48_00560 [Vicinamibacterales bacterium]|nr:hypothetical protein [Vicinamibacterales bacterium]
MAGVTPAAWAQNDAAEPPLVTQHPALREALARIERGSASWRAAMDEVAGLGRRALVVTPDQVVVRDAATGATAPFDQSAVAEVSPAADEHGNVTAVLVVVNVARIQQIHERSGSLPAEFHADLDRVLAHEVYGHAVPLLIAGHLSGRCADPDRGQSASESCAIRRENVVRRELRLGRRTDAALASLTLAWLGSR